MDTQLAALCAAGLSIVAIPPFNGQPSKAPHTSNWNKPRSASNSNGYSANVTDFIGCHSYNFGIHHGSSGTLAFDIDDMAITRRIFDELTDIQLLDWLEDESRLEIKSPRPNRGKLLFKLPKGFNALGVKLYKKPKPDVPKEYDVVFELRCGDGAQDVILGRHPEGGDYQLIGNPAAIPNAPAVLLDMLENWEEWKICFDSALGIAEPPKIAPRKPQKGDDLEGRRDPIKEFNQALVVAAVLTRNGYKQVTQDRFIRPNSSSNAPAVAIMRNCKDGIERIYSHGGDCLNDGYAHDAFDCFKILECGGDQNTALAWNVDITKHNQRLYKQQTQSQVAHPKPAISGDIDALFNDMYLTQEQVQKMANTRFLIPNIIPQCHITLFAAPANGGKSALFRYFCEKLSKDGLKVIYINVDAGPGDLKKHHAHAKQHGYKIVAPDACEGKSAEDVTELLRTIADGNAPCDEYVFILDTLKKFTDVINKSKAKEFYKLLRKLTVKGATICPLGHCNKYKDEEGKPIYEGTADLRNDIDNLIYLDSCLNESTNILEVTTRPDKVRAEFRPMSFTIDRNNGLKVTPADKPINILPDEDRLILDTAKQAIIAGFTNQAAVVDYIKDRSGFGEKKITKKLKQYSGGSNAEITATRTGMGKELQYSVT